MKIPSGFTPLTELSPEISTLHMGLPEFVPADQIALNMRAIGSVARWGGFNREVAIRQYGGEVSSYNASVVGHDGNGAAFMGGVSSSLADKSQADFDSSGKASEHDNVWRARTDLTLRVNMNEVADRVQRSGTSVRSPEIWGTELSQAIGSGLKKATFEHLLGRPIPSGELGSFLLGMGFTVARHLSDGVPEIDSHTMPLTISAGIAANNTFKLMKSVVMHHSPDALCYSLVPGFQADRCAVVAGMTATRTFAKSV